MIRYFLSLRLWLPGLLITTDADFEQVYQTVAWLCWVPNLIITELYLQGQMNKRHQPLSLSY